MAKKKQRRLFNLYPFVLSDIIRRVDIFEEANSEICGIIKKFNHSFVYALPITNFPLLISEPARKIFARTESPHPAIIKEVMATLC